MTVLTSSDVSASIKRVQQTLSKTFENSKGQSLRTTKGDLVIQTRLQTIFSLKFSNPSDALIYETILTQALNAERLSPGGFDTCIEMVLGGLESHDTVATVSSMKAFLKSLESLGARHVTRSDINTTISKTLDDRARQLVETALSLSGFGGKIVVEKATTEVNSVELIRGYTYKLRPEFPVSLRANDVAIACIDGFVESVAEIHQLLESSSEAKVPVLLFVRGIADEVRHTLKINFDRGSLRVVPFITPFDLEGINTLVDIATVADSDVLSTTKGQLISTLKLSDLTRVPTCSVFPDRVVIVNPRSQERVRTQVKHLKVKRLDAIDESLARLYDLRIKSLSPNQVVMRLANDDKYVPTAQAIDYVLRSLKSLSDHGLTHEGESIASKATGISAAVRCLTMLTSLGAVITQER